MNKTILYIIFILFFLSQNSYAELVKDNVADELLTTQITTPPSVHTSYDYSSIEYKVINLRIINDVASEQDLRDGDKLCFEIVNPVYYKGKKYADKNEKVYATVETIIKNGMNGIPASIILGNFEFKNIEKSKIQDYVEIYGADLSWLVFPLKWALTILPPTGSLTNFIKGGHAKIKNSEIIEIKFYPNR